ncbi:MAG: hypothetical protein NVS4B2_09530 [Chloroflexota bacterium]
MEPSTPETITHRDDSADLKAAVNARRELGVDLEDHVLEAFLARVQERIDARVDRRMAESGRPAVRSGHAPPLGVEKIAAPMALAIPLIAIAGGIAGGVGVIAVMAALTIIIALVFVDRWR